MKNYTFHVTGTHCPSCKILIEDILSEQNFVNKVNVDLKKEIIEIETESMETASSLASVLTEKIKVYGYTLSTEHQPKADQPLAGKNNVIWKAIPIGILFLVLFFILQKSGILNFGFGGGIGVPTAFLIGVIASLSSCLAIVGGLVLSLSAELMEDDSKNKKPILLFHAGRLVGFAILGGVLGLIGDTIGVSLTFSTILGIIASLVMIILGLNLVGTLKKNKITLPSHIFSFFRKVEHQTFAPLLIGVGTFFLPCGFTQSMQVVALSSGSFITGSLIMFSFALGTLPILALLSFGSVTFAHSKHAPLFFKSAGVIVIGLGLFALLAGLAGLGLINPLFNI